MYATSQINDFDKLIEASGWQPIDGPARGVFAVMPAGHKCVWTALWLAFDGRINPSTCRPDDSDTQLIRFEISDYAGRGDPYSIQLLRDFDNQIPQAVLHCKDVRRRLCDAEPYVFPFTPLSPTVAIRYTRPSWSVDTVEYYRQRKRLQEVA